MFFKKLIDKFDMSSIDQNYFFLQVWALMKPRDYSKKIEELKSKTFPEQSLLFFTKKELNDNTSNLSSIGAFPPPNFSECIETRFFAAKESIKNHQVVTDRLLQLQLETKQSQPTLSTYNNMFIHYARLACKAALKI